MKKIDPSLVYRASATWAAFASQWGINAQAPFALRVGHQSIACIAFLPDFGSPNGMVVAAMDLPEFGPDDRVSAVARSNGWFYTFLNVSAFAPEKNVDARVIREALEDWGYYGSPASKPSWLVERGGPRRSST